MKRNSIHGSLPGAVGRLLLAILWLSFPTQHLPAQTGAIGLSTVGAARFVQDSVAGYGPQDDDRFAGALAAGDFNGDGGVDLATGAPKDDGLLATPIVDCGAVVLRYGLPGSGLVPGVTPSILNQIGGGSPDPAEAGDGFGSSLAVCDFNNDDFDDLAVGVPDEDLNIDNPGSGAVEVYYGTSGGLPPSVNHHITQETAGVPGSSEAFDTFGFSLACGDFNGDGFADLAIGEPGSGSGAITLAGSIDILYGAAGGLLPANAVTFDQASTGVEGEREALDHFGAALVVGDFDGDGFDDLAVGVPGEDNPGIGTPGADTLGRGAVAILFGGPSGVSSDGDLVRTESDLGGVSENGDRLGSALAPGDFDGDGFDDLAIGVPFEDFSGSAIVEGGKAATLYGASSGIDFTRTQFWSEDDLLGGGTTEPGDRFGFALAAGDFDGDGHDELAIGHPGEFLMFAGEGAVTVVRGSATGLSPAIYRTLHSGQEGLPGPANLHARGFGQALASRDFDTDGFGDLVIGEPGEEVDLIFAAGAEVVLYGSTFADGFDSESAGFWSGLAP